PRIIWIQCNRCFEFRPRFWNAILQATKLPSDSVRHLAVGIAVESFAEQPIRPHFVLLRRLTHAVTKVQDEHGRDAYARIDRTAIELQCAFEGAQGFSASVF